MTAVVCPGPAGAVLAGTATSVTRAPLTDAPSSPATTLTVTVAVPLGGGGAGGRWAGACGDIAATTGGGADDVAGAEDAASTATSAPPGPFWSDLRGSSPRFYTDSLAAWLRVQGLRELPVRKSKR